MNLTRHSRVLMILALIPAVLAMSYIVWTFSWQVLGSYANLGEASPLYLTIFLGSVVTLVFIAMTITIMAGTKPVSRWTFALGVILGIIGCIGTAFFLLGVFQDMMSAHCTGFFGAKASCTLGPLLIIYILVIHPVTLGTTGLLSLVAIIMQIRITPSSKSTEKSA